MGSQTTRALRQRLVYFGVLLVLFLVAFAGFVWLFFDVVFFSSS